MMQESQIVPMPRNDVVDCVNWPERTTCVVNGAHRALAAD